MIRYAHVTDSDAVAGLARLPAMPTLTLGLTQAPVTNGHDVARIGTTLDGQSEPNSVVIPLPNGYLSKNRADILRITVRGTGVGFQPAPHLFTRPITNGLNLRQISFWRPESA